MEHDQAIYYIAKMNVGMADVEETVYTLRTIHKKGDNANARSSRTEHERTR